MKYLKKELKLWNKLNKFYIERLLFNQNNLYYEKRKNIVEENINNLNDIIGDIKEYEKK